MPTKVTTIWLHADNPYQKVTCIGASDGVGVEAVGRWRNGEEKEKVAALLFDTGFDDQGFPCGVGLSSWRFRLGGGSKRTGEGALATQLDTFLRDDWSAFGLDDVRAYDFSRCPGQQWFLHTANKYHLPTFTACSHAPPYPLVPSATTQNPYNCNLWSGDTLLGREYATYLSKVCRYFNTLGVTFKKLSPVRATHTGGGVVEGCKYTHKELLSVLQCLDEELGRFGMETELVVPDSISIDFLTSTLPGKEDSSDFLYAFFGGRCPHALPRMTMITCASYLTCWPEGDRLVGARQLLGQQMQRLTLKFGVSFGVSEYSVRIPCKDGRIPKNVRRKAESGELQDSTDINSALWCARVIQADLAIGCASSWHYTDAISTEHTRDGLIEVDTRHEGYFRPTKMLWMLGHFSLFIRPGMTRIRVTRDDDLTFRDCQHGLLTTAYINKSSFTVVMVNVGESVENTALEFCGSSTVVNTASCFRSYITNEEASLSTFTSSHLGVPFVVPPRSIVTCVGSLIEEDVHYRVQPRATEQDLCLQVTSDKERSIAGLGYCSEVPFQKWSVVPCEAHVMLMNIKSSMVLTASPQEGQHALPVHQELVRVEQKDNQLWDVTYTKSGGYIFRSISTDMVLEYYGDSVRLADRTAKATQQWELVALTQHKENLPHLLPEKLPHGHIGSPRRRSILTPKHVEPPNGEWKGARPDFVNDTLDEPPGPPKIIAVAVPARPLHPHGRYAEVTSPAEDIQAPPFVSTAPEHYAKPDDPMDKVQHLRGPGTAAWPDIPEESSDGSFAPPKVAKSSSFKKLPASALSPRMTEVGRYSSYQVASPHSGAPSSVASSPAPAVGALPPKQSAAAQSPFAGKGRLPFSTVGRQTSSVVYDTTLQAEIDRRREENELIKRQVLERKEKEDREISKRHLEKEAEEAAKMKIEKEEQEESLRAQRRGTSHLVLSLSMTRGDFDFAFQRTFRETIARKLQISERNVITALVGQDSKSIKVEVRLKGIVDAGNRLDELFEAVSSMEKSSAAAVGDEGIGSQDESGESSEEEAKKAGTEGRKKSRRRRRSRSRTE